MSTGDNRWYHQLTSIVSLEQLHKGADFTGPTRASVSMAYRLGSTMFIIYHGREGWEQACPYETGGNNEINFHDGWHNERREMRNVSEAYRSGRRYMELPERDAGSRAR